MHIIYRARKGRLLSAALASTLGLALASPAWSQATPASDAGGNLALLAVLLHNGVITQTQYDQLAAQARAREAASSAAAVATAPSASAAPASPPAPTAVVAGNAATDAANHGPPAAATKPALINLTPFKSKDADFTIKLGGRLQVDYGFADNDKGPHIGNAQETRRARFDVSGTMFHDWSYMVSYDFASSHPIKNLYVNYEGFKDTDITIGYFKEFFSLEYQTTNKALELNERSMLNDVVDPPKRFGLGYFRHSKFGEHSEYTLGVGVFGNAYPRDTDDDRGSGVGVAVRATYAPIHTDDRLLHFGANFEYRHDGKTEGVDLAAHPNADFADPLIDTGDILNVDRQQKIGGEVAAVYGRLAMQAQYDTLKLNRIGSPDLNYHGYYGQLSYFLTDDTRAAAYDEGSYGTIKPHSKYGAWQLAVRYDELDLNDRGLIGGEEGNFDSALNWYVNRYLRFSTDYIKVMKLHRPGDINDGNKPTLVVARMWIGF